MSRLLAMWTASSSIAHLLGEADFGKAEEDEPQDRLGVLGGAQAAVGPELVGSSPKTLFQGISGEVFFRRCDPLHSAEYRRICSTERHSTQ